MFIQLLCAQSGIKRNTQAVAFEVLIQHRDHDVNIQQLSRRLTYADFALKAQSA